MQIEKTTEYFCAFPQVKYVQFHHVDFQMDQLNFLFFSCYLCSHITFLGHILHFQQYVVHNLHDSLINALTIFLCVCKLCIPLKSWIFYMQKIIYTSVL